MTYLTPVFASTGLIGPARRRSLVAATPTTKPSGEASASVKPAVEAPPSPTPGRNSLTPNIPKWFAPSANHRLARMAVEKGKHV